MSIPVHLHCQGCRVTRVTHVFNSIWQGITIPRHFLALYFPVCIVHNWLFPKPCFKKKIIHHTYLRNCCDTFIQKGFSNELFVFSFGSLCSFISLHNLVISLKQTAGNNYLQCHTTLSAHFIENLKIPIACCVKFVSASNSNKWKPISTA